MTDAELMFAGAAIMLAWEAGELSEGQVCRALNIDRVTARVERDKLVQSGLNIFSAMTGRPIPPRCLASAPDDRAGE